MEKRRLTLLGMQNHLFREAQGALSRQGEKVGVLGNAAIHQILLPNVGKKLSQRSQNSICAAID